jgi:hypothetical protein
MAEQPKQRPGEHWAEKRGSENPITPTIASQGIDKNLARRPTTTHCALAKHRARRLRNDYAKVSQALEENSWRWSPKSSKVSHVKQSSDIT